LKDSNKVGEVVEDFAKRRVVQEGVVAVELSKPSSLHKKVVVRLCELLANYCRLFLHYCSNLALMVVSAI
jgi:hypothetical protein